MLQSVLGRKMPAWVREGAGMPASRAYFVDQLCCAVNVCREGMGGVPSIGPASGWQMPAEAHK